MNNVDEHQLLFILRASYELVLSRQTMLNLRYKRESESEELFAGKCQLVDMAVRLIDKEILFKREELLEKLYKWKREG